MVEVPFTVEIGIALSPLREGYLGEIQCIAESEVTGPDLNAVYAIVLEGMGDSQIEHRIPVHPDGWQCKHPILQCLARDIWREARGQWVTDELASMWADAHPETVADRWPDPRREYGTHSGRL